MEYQEYQYEKRYVEQVKLFQDSTVKKLEKRINEFLSQNPNIEIVDIRLSVTEMFETVLLLYRIRGEER